MIPHCIRVILLLLVSTNTQAVPTKDLWIPQTITLPQGKLRFDLSNRFHVDKRMGDHINSGQRVNELGFAYGVYTQGSVGVEVGLDWREPAVEEVLEAAYGHVRVRAFDLYRDGWSVAIGVDSVGFKSKVTDQNMIYLVLQNTVPRASLVAEIGGYSGSSQHFITSEGKSDAQGFLVGVWRKITKSGDTRDLGHIGLEYQSGRNQYGFLFAGFRVLLKEKVQGTLGYGVANVGSTVRNSALVRLGVEF